MDIACQFALDLQHWMCCSDVFCYEYSQYIFRILFVAVVYQFTEGVASNFKHTSFASLMSPTCLIGFRLDPPLTWLRM